MGLGEGMQLSLAQRAREDGQTLDGSSIAFGTLIE